MKTLALLTALVLCAGCHASARAGYLYSLDAPEPRHGGNVIGTFGLGIASADGDPLSVSIDGVMELRGARDLFQAGAGGEGSAFLRVKGEADEPGMWVFIFARARLMTLRLGVVDGAISFGVGNPAVEIGLAFGELEPASGRSGTGWLVNMFVGADYDVRVTGQDNEGVLLFGIGLDYFL